MVSVTEVMDYLTEKELLEWMLRTPKARREQTSEEAKRVGSLVDKAIQADLRQVEPVKIAAADIASANCWQAWQRFKLERPEIIRGIQVNEIQQELRLGDLVGHPDLPYEDEDRWGILDVKCSRSIYPRYFTQTAQYSEMKLMSNPSYINTWPRFIGIVRLDKESGNYEYIEITDEKVIQYEVSIFAAYRLAYDHNFKVREIVRQQLEMEAGLVT